MEGFLGPTFLPSEIARLVLGYLKVEGCTESYNVFLNESRYLAEYRNLLQQGQEFPTSIVGKGLTDMLEEYGQLKIQETNPANDVLGKFDKAVNQLRSLTRLSQNTVTLKKNTVHSFQKRRASQNLKKNNQFKVPISYTDENDLALRCNASVTSDPASSPRSNMDYESPNSSVEPNSSNEAQSSVSLSQHYSHSSSHGTQSLLNDNLTTSTPGRGAVNDNTLTSQSFPLPYQSPIVVSDGDSYPGTPRYQNHLDQSGNNRLNEVSESPKTVKSGEVYVCSPLRRVRNESFNSSPKGKVQGSVKHLHTNDNNNATKSHRQKQIDAMRTGKLSKLLTASNIDEIGKFTPIPLLPKSKPVELKKDVTEGKNVCAQKKDKKTERMFSLKKQEINSQNEAEDIQDIDNGVDDEDSLMIASPVKVSNVISLDDVDKRNNNTTPQKNVIQSVLPVVKENITPAKQFVKRQESIEFYRSPKRKSHAPKRRSCDTNTVVSPVITPMSTPAKQNPSMQLSMPQSIEMLINSELPVKLADVINKNFSKAEEDSKQRRQNKSSQNATPVKKTVSESTLTKSPSPSHRKSLSPQPSDASGSLKPSPKTTSEEYDKLNLPLDQDVDDLLNEQMMQQIITMAEKSYPQGLEDLLNIFQMDNVKSSDEAKIYSTCEKGSSECKDQGAAHQQLSSRTQEIIGTTSKYTEQPKNSLTSTSLETTTTMSTKTTANITSTNSLASIPTIHVKSVTTTNTATTEMQTSSTNSGFLHLLHNSTDKSYIETVQVIDREKKVNTSLDTTSGFEPVMTPDSVNDSAKKKENPTKCYAVEASGQDTTDSNGSDDAFLELPNGVTVKVLPAGTDINSQMQTLNTLTSLQSMLANGYTLVPAADSSPAECGMNNDTGNVIEQNTVFADQQSKTDNATGSTTTTSSTMASETDTPNTSLDTVDTSDLDLITAPSKNGDVKIRLNNEEKPKKKRGRPPKCAAKNNTADKKTRMPKRNRNSPLVNGKDPLHSPSKRLGIKNSRTDRRRNLGLPSTITISSEITERTHGMPFESSINGEKVLLIPERINSHAPLVNDLDLTKQIVVSTNNQVSQSLLETSMANSILGESTINSLTSTSSCQVSNGLENLPLSSGIQEVTTNSESSPNPRRKLFGSGSTGHPKLSNSLSANSPHVHRQGNASPPVLSSHETTSVGSMILSPVGGNGLNANLASLLGAKPGNVNSIQASKSGIYYLPEYFQNTKLSNETLISVIPKSTNSIMSSQVNSTATVLSSSSETVQSWLNDFNSISSASSLQSSANIEKKSHSVNSKKSENSNFQSVYPNIVSNDNLKSQPGVVEEIISPTCNFKSRSIFHEENTCLSVDTALKMIDCTNANECTETIAAATTLIDFASKPVVTPKKLCQEVANSGEKSKNSSPVKPVIENLSNVFQSSPVTYSAKKERKSTLKTPKKNNREEILKQKGKSQKIHKEEIVEEKKEVNVTKSGSIDKKIKKSHSSSTLDDVLLNINTSTPGECPLTKKTSKSSEKKTKKMKRHSNEAKFTPDGSREKRQTIEFGSPNKTSCDQKSTKILKTPTKQKIPSIVKGTSPHRSLSLAKLAELGTNELKSYQHSPVVNTMSFSPLRNLNESGITNSRSAFTSESTGAKSQAIAAVPSSKIMPDVPKNHRKRKFSQCEENDHVNTAKTGVTKAETKNLWQFYETKIQTQEKLDDVLKKLESKKRKKKNK